jgi:hypothetical protein
LMACRSCGVITRDWPWRISSRCDNAIASPERLEFDPCAADRRGSAGLGTFFASDWAQTTPRSFARQSWAVSFGLWR